MVSRPAVPARIAANRTERDRRERRERDPEEDRGEDRPAPKATAETDGERERLRRDQHQDDSARVLCDEARERRLTGEQHVLRVRAEAVGQERQGTGGEPAADE